MNDPRVRDMLQHWQTVRARIGAVIPDPRMGRIIQNLDAAYGESPS